jgi:hypothetical protein
VVEPSGGKLSHLSGLDRLAPPAMAHSPLARQREINIPNCSFLDQVSRYLGLYTFYNTERRLCGHDTVELEA